MKISIFEGNEKIPFWSRVTKSCAKNNCHDREKLCFTLGDVRVENQNLCYSAEILFRGKIRLLITEMS